MEFRSMAYHCMKICIFYSVFIIAWILAGIADIAWLSKIVPILFFSCWMKKILFLVASGAGVVTWAAHHTSPVTAQPQLQHSCPGTHSASPYCVCQVGSLAMVWGNMCSGILSQMVCNLMVQIWYNKVSILLILTAVTCAKVWHV